jgi:hypothetical protein
MAKSKTHFEQVPLATIKKTAEEQNGTNVDAEAVVEIEGPTKKTEPYSVGVSARSKAKG